MMSTDRAEPFAQIERALIDTHSGCPHGDEITFRCPYPDRHNSGDANPSASWNRIKRVWLCRVCGQRGGYVALARALGIELPPEPQRGERRLVARYDYRDERSAVLYQVERLDPKAFRQRRPERTSGWIYRLDGVRRVLYRLPEVLAADPEASVFIVEGERDVETLRALGFVATTNVGGAGKWRDEYSETLRSKRTVVLQDNDPSGEHHVAKVAGSLHGKAASVKTLLLPGLPPRGDVSDWLAAGHTRDELLALVDVAPEWQPAADSPRRDALRFTAVGALLDEPDESTEWLVDGLLPAGGFGVLVGKPKAGKSTLGRNLCKAVAQGEPFLGRATRQGAVLYLALEEKRSQVRAHFRALGVRSDAPLKVFVGATPADGRAQLRAALEAELAVLVIIDPLFRFVRVRDGNDYAAMTAALDPVLRLARDSGACVLMTHHSPKGDRADVDAALGSTAIAGSVDTLLVLKRSDRYRTLSSVQRVGDDMAETVIELDPETRAVSASGTRQEADVLEMKAALLEHLHTLAEPAEESTIQDAVEGRKQVKVRALRALLADGKVERNGSGKKGDPYHYYASGSLVPNISGEPENQKLKSAESIRQASPFSGSQGSPEMSPGSEPEIEVFEP